MPIESKHHWSEDGVVALLMGEHDYFERKSGALLAKENYRDSLGKAVSGVLTTFARKGTLRRRAALPEGVVLPSG
jgi:RNA:NAD 2'-phosphotransferase (TPT1/KptA family)